MTEDADLQRELDRRRRAAWGAYKKFSKEMFDRSNAPRGLKVRLLKAEAM